MIKYELMYRHHDIKSRIDYHNANIIIILKTHYDYQFSTRIFDDVIILKKVDIRID